MIDKLPRVRITSYLKQLELFILNQRFLTVVLQKILKHAVLNYLIKGTKLFSLRLLN